MYNIDLSFFNSSVESIEEIENKCNAIYQHFIVDSAGNQSNCCDNCAKTAEETNEHSQNIILAESKGILGTHYCTIPESYGEELRVGDKFITRFNDSHELSQIIEIGEFVQFRICKTRFAETDIPIFVRKINEYDNEKISRNEKDENKAKPYFYELINKYSLEMKLVDIHFQFDRKKMYFFYTADGRVDFRQLAKGLAGKFKTRIELRQIGVRDEAKIKGGLGTCGREYCCSSFMNSFKHISTQFANDQHLSSNLTKLSGPCGKLKCCLSFELNK